MTAPLALLLLLGGTVESPVIARLQRAGYVIAVHDDGEVETEGAVRSDVPTLPAAQVLKLKKLFFEARFLDTEYPACAAKDAQVTKLFFSDGKKKQKTVEYIRGPFCASSASLEPLAEKVHELTGVTSPK